MAEQSLLDLLLLLLWRDRAWTLLHGACGTCLLIPYKLHDVLSFMLQGTGLLLKASMLKHLMASKYERLISNKTNAILTIKSTVMSVRVATIDKNPLIKTIGLPVSVYTLSYLDFQHSDSFLQDAMFLRD